MFLEIWQHYGISGKLETNLLAEIDDTLKRILQMHMLLIRGPQRTVLLFLH
jgi:hypothetical protein